MFLSALCSLTLVLVALGLAPGAAHIMEMPVKLMYAPELYTAVTSYFSRENYVAACPRPSNRNRRAMPSSFAMNYGPLLRKLKQGFG
jgi:hypothetical protein